jgi:hypothetical protein
MEQLRARAISLGATEFGPSKVKNKRFYVIYKGHRINFGSDTNNTFIDHGDEKLRKAWRARHSKIKLKDGRLAYTVPTQPEYYSWHLLW